MIRSKPLRRFLAGTGELSLLCLGAIAVFILMVAAFYTGVLFLDALGF